MYGPLFACCFDALLFLNCTNSSLAAGINFASKSIFFLKLLLDIHPFHVVFYVVAQISCPTIVLRWRDFAKAIFEKLNQEKSLICEFAEFKCLEKNQPYSIYNTTLHTHLVGEKTTHLIAFIQQHLMIDCGVNSVGK